MKKSTLLLLAALFSILYFSSCDDNPTPTPREPVVTDYFPLEVGAYWTYETYSENTSGELELSSLDTLSVTNSYMDGEDTVYELTKTSNGLFNSFFSDQIRERNGELFAENESLLLTVDENQVGEIVRRDTMPADLGYVDYRFLEGTTLIESPAGNFDCVNFQGEVRANDTTQAVHEKLLDNYYAEGVGLVRGALFFWSSGRSIEIRLTAYELP